jgi:hypothetical protein
MGFIKAANVTKAKKSDLAASIVALAKSFEFAIVEVFDFVL